MKFHLGCAVWSWKGWVGELFPPGSKPSEFLHLYSRRLTAVEGNTTFYAIPSAPTVARWVAEVPPNFHFCLKLNRDITHSGALTPQLALTEHFLEQTAVLGENAGPYFAQLPPSYGPGELSDLETFLRAWPGGRARLALEVRQLGWFRPAASRRLNSLLESLQLGRVLLDTRPLYLGGEDPQLIAERKKPKVPLEPVATAPFVMVRFITHPDRAINEPFIDEWVDQVASWLSQGIEVYFFVHCPVEDFSAGTARIFQERLEKRLPGVPPLPWQQLLAAGETLPTVATSAPTPTVSRGPQETSTASPATKSGRKKSEPTTAQLSLFGGFKGGDSH